VTTPLASLAAGSGLYFTQPVEGYRFARLAYATASAQPITVAFWIKAFRAGTYACTLSDPAWHRQYRQAFTISASNTWEYKTVTFPGDTGGAAWSYASAPSGTGLYVILALAAGTSWVGAANAWTDLGVGDTSGKFGIAGQTNGMASTSDYFQITGLLVVPGNEAPLSDRSPHIMRPIADELRLCQRYFEKTYPFDTAPGSVLDSDFSQVQYMVTPAGVGWWLAYSIPFKQPKRDTPTITCYSPTTGASGVVNGGTGGTMAVNMSSVGVTIGKNSFILWGADATSTTIPTLKAHWVAKARL
jgi:hypothetical protein